MLHDAIRSSDRHCTISERASGAMIVHVGSNVCSHASPLSSFNVSSSQLLMSPIFFNKSSETLRLDDDISRELLSLMLSQTAFSTSVRLSHRAASRCRIASSKAGVTPTMAFSNRPVSILQKPNLVQPHPQSFGVACGPAVEIDINLERRMTRISTKFARGVMRRRRQAILGVGVGPKAVANRLKSPPPPNK